MKQNMTVKSVSSK